jgi:WD40 repeat protein/energy-coupling factor transporter ATP-binding protein EcfA2
LNSPKQVFLSYNSQDREKVRAVHAFLKKYKLDTFLDEQHLSAGRNWPQALEQALNDASAVVVFVGSRTGRWQRNEIGFALDRQASDERFPVIPVLLDGADASRSFLFLNTWIDLRGERLHYAEALGRLIDAVAGRTGSDEPGPLIDINPYRGLEYFDEDHAPFFFGRESFIEDLFNRLTAQRKKFVAVIGASGSGKSSVVRAGLIPKLRRQRPPQPTWDVAVFTPGERPWFRLAEALGPLSFPDKNDTDLHIEIDKLARALQSGELTLESVLDRILQPQGKLHRLLLVVDQFEELFTPKAEHTPFIDHLVASLAVEGLVLVPTLRADFYGQAIEANRQLSDLLGREQVTLGRLTEKELTRAIVEPAKLARLEFDAGLPELLLRDAGNEPGNLPLLQHALAQLYTDPDRNGNRLTSEGYQKISGIRKAIAKTAEQAFARFASEGKGDVVRSVFTELVRLARADEGWEDTRRRVATTQLSADAKRIVDEFAGPGYRLLVKTSARVAVNGQTTEQTATSEQEIVEVAHEALIREWDRLQRWLNEDRGFYLWRQRLDQVLQEYQECSNADYLLRGAALKEAESRLDASMPEPLSERHLDFIRVSVEQRDRQKLAMRKARVIRGSVITLLLIAIGTIAVFAWRQWDSKLAESLILASRQETDRGLSTVGMLLALEASHRQTTRALPKANAEAALLRAMFRQREKYILTSPQCRHAEGVTQISFAPANALAATAADNGAVCLWNSETGNLVGSLDGHEAGVHRLDFAPDSALLATASADNTAKVWATRTKTNAATLRHKDQVFSVSFSRNGLYLATASADHTAVIWDTKSWQPVATLAEHTGAVYEATFSPNAERIVTASADKTARVWDVRSGKTIAVLEDHEDSVLSARFSPDGKRVVTASWDHSARIWDFSSKSSILLRGHTLGINSATFSNDGRLVATASADGTARLWNGATGALVTTLIGHTALIRTAQFNPQGAWLITASEDNTARLWDVQSHKTIEVLRGHQGLVQSAAFSQDGLLVGTTSRDNSARIWDVSMLRDRVLRGHRDRVHSAIFSPGDHYIATISDDKTARFWSGTALSEFPPAFTSEGALWYATFSRDGKYFAMASTTGMVTIIDTATRTVVRPLPAHKSLVYHLSFSPDGARILTAGHDGRATIWEVESGRNYFDKKVSEEPLQVAEFSHDGQRFVTASFSGVLQLRDAHTGELIASMAEHRGAIINAAFSSDDRRLVTVSADATARVWDGKNGKPVSVLRGHADAVMGAAFSPNGLLVATASKDNTGAIWDADSGQRRHVLLGHDASVNSASFSEDGRLVLTSSNDRTARIWHALTGTEVAILMGHTDSVVSATFDSAGKNVVTASHDHTARVWQLPAAIGQDWIEHARRTVPRTLTPEELRDYLNRK